jgi:hypothetical protein
MYVANYYRVRAKLEKGIIWLGLTEIQETHLLNQKQAEKQLRKREALNSIVNLG